MNNAISEKPQCAACSISPHTKPIKIHQSTAEVFQELQTQTGLKFQVNSPFTFTMNYILLYMCFVDAAFFYTDIDIQC